MNKQFCNDFCEENYKGDQRVGLIYETQAINRCKYCAELLKCNCENPVSAGFRQNGWIICAYCSCCIGKK